MQYPCQRNNASWEQQHGNDDRHYLWKKWFLSVNKKRIGNVLKFMDFILDIFYKFEFFAAKFEFSYCKIVQKDYNYCIELHVKCGNTKRKPTIGGRYLSIYGI